VHYFFIRPLARSRRL